MSTGIYSIGLTGLQAAQLALLTTENNVANANTAGYTRQRTVQATNLGIMTGAGSIGQGVHVSTIERLYSSFLVNQVNGAQTNVSELSTFSSQINQIDNMLADASAGLSPALQEFFSNVQKMAASPSLLPNRQSMVSSAETLVQRFQMLQGRLDQLGDQVNDRIESAVTSINTYTGQIADLNQRIIIAQAGYNQPPNDLLDQRDTLVAELNKLVKVNTNTNSDGSINLFIGSGQQLVIGSQAMTVATMKSSADPTKLTIGLSSGSGAQELPESLITGGELGGLLSFRTEALYPAANELGRVAVSLALTVNAQQALGQDLLGRVAGTGLVSSFFTLSAPEVVASSYNTGSGAVTASYIDPAAEGNFTLSFAAGLYTVTRASDGQSWSNASLSTLQSTVNSATGHSLTLPSITSGSVAVNDGKFFTNLTASDYQVAFGAAGAFTITRLSDNTVVASGSGTGTTYVDGIAVNIGTVGANGDKFLVEPTRNAARNIEVDARFSTDPRLIAAAAPVKTTGGLTNAGQMTLSQGSVNTGYSLASLPVTLTAGAATLSGFPAAAAVTAFYADGTSAVITGGPVNLVNGASPLAKVSFSGMNFTVNGTPSVGDTFVIAANTGGTGDGRNGILLGALQTAATVAGGTATYQAAYAELVGDVGIKARDAKVRGAAQEAILTQAQNAHDELSGVNLDEEAANLIKFQQAYQASAKMLQIASELFDTILQLG